MNKDKISCSESECRTSPPKRWKSSHSSHVKSAWKHY